jgi:hypothetical protein
LGKSFFALFCGCLCFHTSKWFTIAIGCALWVVCIIYFVLGWVFVDEEHQKLNSVTPNQQNNNIQQEVKVGPVEKV